MATPSTKPNPTTNGGTSLTVMDKNFIAVRHVLESPEFMSQLQMALPRFIQPERFMRVVLTTLRRTPKLMECDRLSLYGALLQSAQCGLECDGVQAALVPYKGEVQFHPMYKGYIAMSRRTGEIKSFEAHAVREGDAFAYEWGTSKFLKHRPKEDNFGAPTTHYYSVVEYTNEGIDFEVMTRAEVEHIRSSAPMPDSPAWKNHYDEMGKKTVLRRHAKRLPMSSESMSMLVKAATLDEMADAGVAQNLGAEIHSSEIIRQATTARMADLREKYANGNAAAEPVLTEAQLAEAKRAQEELERRRTEPERPPMMQQPGVPVEEPYKGQPDGAELFPPPKK